MENKSKTKPKNIKQILSYYVIFKNRVMFRDFWLPRAWGRYYKTRYYQYPPALCDDVAVYGGRSIGKSICMEGTIVQTALNEPSQESVVTAFRRLHIRDRLEKVISFFYNVKYWRKFLLGDADRSLKTSVRRSPTYEVKLKNRHIIYGISTGDDPLCVNLQGQHPNYRYLEEGQNFLRDAWIQFQSARDPKFVRDRFYGTCLLPGTRINTINGIKNIEDVNVGDYVLSHTGEFRKVMKTTFRNYSGNIISFYSQLSNIEIKLTENHLIYGLHSFPCWISNYRNNLTNCHPRPKNKRCVKCYRKQYLYYKPSWIEAKSFNPGDYIVFPRNINYSMLENKELIDLNNFLILGKEKYYKGIKNIKIDDNFIIIVGAYLAEGSIDFNRITFTFKKDEELFFKTIDALKKVNINYCIKEKGSAVDVRVANAPFARMMESYFGKGAINKKIPQWIYNIDNNLIELLFDVYIMGDGHNRKREGKNNREICATSISDKLLYSLQLLSLKINKDCSILARTFNEKNKFVKFKNYISKVKQAYNMGYDKKYYTFNLDNYLYLMIKYIKKENYKGIVYNLEIEEDNSYTSGLVCLHNCDGRIDTPYHDCDEKISKFKNKRFHLSRRLEPWFDQETKNNLIETFKGEDSNEFKQQCDGEWGEPVWGVWPEKDIIKCLDKKEDPHQPGVFANQITTIILTPKDYTNMSPDQVLWNLPKLPEQDLEVIIGIDGGYSEPTVILPFFYYKNKWNLRCKILLRDKMIADDQAELIDYICDFYNAMIIPIDCTSAEGRSVAQALTNPKRQEYINKKYPERVLQVNFNSTEVIGYTDKNRSFREGEENKAFKEEEIKEKVKNLTTIELYKMFSNHMFDIYYDEDLLGEFNSEVQKKSPSGNYVILTPRNVHIPETFRVFAYAWWKKYGKVDKPERKSSICGFVLPEYGDSGVSIFDKGKTKQKPFDTGINQ